MPDLVIREEDGWYEISGLVRENLAGQIINDLWTLVVEGQEDESTDLLNRELGDALYEQFGSHYVSRIRMLECPKEGVRIWARR